MVFTLLAGFRGLGYEFEFYLEVLVSLGGDPLEDWRVYILGFCYGDTRNSSAASCGFGYTEHCLILDLHEDFIPWPMFVVLLMLPRSSYLAVPPISRGCHGTLAYPARPCSKCPRSFSSAPVSGWQVRSHIPNPQRPEGRSTNSDMSITLHVLVT